MTGLRPGRLRQLTERGKMNAGTVRSSNQAQHPGKRFAYHGHGLTPPHFHFHEKRRLLHCRKLLITLAHFWQVSNSSFLDGFIFKLD